MKKHYENLGVANEATEQEIKKEYRKLAKQFHPDKNKGDKIAEERFKSISESYEILSDPEKRKKYDEALRVENLRKENERARHVNVKTNTPQSTFNWGNVAIAASIALVVTGIFSLLSSKDD